MICLRILDCSFNKFSHSTLLSCVCTLTIFPPFFPIYYPTPPDSITTYVLRIPRSIKLHIHKPSYFQAYHKVNIYKFRPFLLNPTLPSKNLVLLFALPILVSSTSNLRLKSFLNILLLEQVAVTHRKRVNNGASFRPYLGPLLFQSIFPTVLSTLPTSLYKDEEGTWW